MVDAETEREVLSRLARAGASNQRLTLSDMTLSPVTSSETGVVAEYQAKRPLEVRQGEPVDIHLVAHETKTTDGTAGNTETFNLQHDLVDADSVPNDLVLYEDGSGEVQPDAVDYSNDTFDYTDDGTNNGLDVYYVVGTQALARIQKVAPKNYDARLKELDAGLSNVRDQLDDPVTFDFRDPVDALVPTDWKIQIYLDAPFAVEWDHDNDGTVENTNALIDIPIRRAESEIDGLAEVVADHI